MSKKINLAGKTIKKVYQVAFKEFPDDQGFIIMEFKDGTNILIQASFGTWDEKRMSKRQDEYPTEIYLFPDYKTDVNAKHIKFIQDLTICNLSNDEEE